MNYILNSIPSRTQKPRNSGFTMAMDKGLSLREVEDFIESNGDYVDIVKLGWATSYVTTKLKEKLIFTGLPAFLYILEVPYLKLLSLGINLKTTGDYWTSTNFLL